MEPHKLQFPRWYDPNNRCNYHSGAQGHSIENCFPLKYKVQSLIKTGWLDFNKNNEPNVTANPLSNHVGPNVNTIMEELAPWTKSKMDEAKSSMDEVYKALIEMWVILEMKILEGNYCYCREASLSSTIKKCERFKALLQRMIDQGEIEFS